MNKTNLVPYVLEQYKQGRRYFENIDIENESFEGENLEGIQFEDCAIYADFRNTDLRNSKFINGGIKTCDFRNADLTNAHFENVCIESARFVGAKIENIYFDNNSSYGQLVTQKDFNDFIKYF